LSPSRATVAIAHPAQGRTRGPHLLRGLRVWRHQLQVILLQEETDDHTHLMQRQMHASAFMHATAEPDQGKRVLTIFGTSGGKAQRIIARRLLEPLRQLVGEGWAEGSQPAPGHAVPSKLIGYGLLLPVGPGASDHAHRFSEHGTKEPVCAVHCQLLIGLLKEEFMIRRSH
jgi:hypothetical protein